MAAAQVTPILVNEMNGHTFQKLHGTPPFSRYRIQFRQKKIEENTEAFSPTKKARYVPNCVLLRAPERTRLLNTAKTHPVGIRANTACSLTFLFKDKDACVSHSRCDLFTLNPGDVI